MLKDSKPDNINKDDESLFIKVFKQLSAYNDSFQPISGMLKDTCIYFDFGGGFIYEADHANVFHLCENYLCYNHEIPKTINLKDFFKSNDIKELVKHAGEIIYFNSKSKDVYRKILSFFDAKTMVLIPVILESKNLVGIVGMVDRRHAIRLKKNDINDAGAVLTVLANQVKIRSYQKSLENIKQSLTSILDNMGVDIYVNDFNTHEILFANKSMAAPYGGVENMHGKKCWKALYDDKTSECDYCPQKKLIDENGNPTKIYSWDYQRPFDGSWFRVLSAAFKWMDGRLAHLVSSIDITEKKQNEKIINEMANYDMLTSLPNRRKMYEDMEESMAKMKEKNATGFLFFLDLDDLKKINDSLGHLEGDELLRQVSKCLRNKNIVKGNVYRHGGDEFIILCENMNKSDAIRFARKIVEKFKKDWQLKKQSVHCGVSIGAASYPSPGKSVDNLIHEADMAMYQVKKTGKGGFRIVGSNEIFQ